jgi:hypothetical protein
MDIPTASPATPKKRSKRGLDVCYDGEVAGRLIPCQAHVYQHMLDCRPQKFLAMDLVRALGTLEVHPRMTEIKDVHPGLIESEPGPAPLPGKRRQHLYWASSRASVKPRGGELTHA